MSKKEIIFYAISIAIISWFVLSILEVQTHNLDHNYKYNKANAIVMLTTKTETMKVVGCEIHKPTDSFLVTVEDAEGNQYSYYDSEYQYPQSEIKITISGNSVTDAK